MTNHAPKLQAILYRVFLVTCLTATAIGLLMIWGIAPSPDAGMLLLRVLGTCVVLAVASAFTMSATRLVAGRPPEDDAG
jgi:hypothetical protein